MIFWDFEEQTDYLIPAGWPEIVVVYEKENLPNSGLRRPGGSQRENQRKRKEIQVLGPCQGTKKPWNMKVRVLPTVISSFGTIPKVR